jgi:hypothetical protein
VEALRVGYGDLGVSYHITNSAVEPGVQVNTNNGTVVITASGDEVFLMVTEVELL